MNQHSWKHTYQPNYTKENWSAQLNELTILWHIAHIDTAVRILQDGKCKSGLVFDEESRLYNSRTLVSWLSPNHWVNGSRYGNIAFEIAFKHSSLTKSITGWKLVITMLLPIAF